MQVIRGTRAPFLAAACAMVVLAAAGADGSPVSVYYTYVTFSSAPPVAGGVDGCPALAGSTYDPRKLCAADLGVDWNPVGARDLQVCPPGPTHDDAVLSTGPMTVSEDIITKPSAALAAMFVHNTETLMQCAAAVDLFAEAGELPSTAIEGSTAEAQLMLSSPVGDSAIDTAVAIGNVVVFVGVSEVQGVPDDVIVLRIVNSAIQRFQNPRPYGGPFSPVTASTSVSPTAP